MGTRKIKLAIKLGLTLVIFVLLLSLVSRHYVITKAMGPSIHRFSDQVTKMEKKKAEVSPEKVIKTGLNVSQTRRRPEIPKQDIELKPSATNVTPSDAKLLFYSAIPRCGSSTMLTLLHSLGIRNGFLHTSSENYTHQRLSIKEQKSLLTYLYNKEDLQSYGRYLDYFDATRLGFPQPVWIGFMRDPINRFISSFNFRRTMDSWNPNRDPKITPPPASWLNKNLDMCLATGDPECIPHRDKNHELQLSNFCGHSSPTQLGYRGAVQQAKYHVQNYFSVVGVLEEYSLSMKVLEKYVPRFFANATAMVLASEKLKMKSTSRKKVISAITRKKLNRVFEEDYELYDFVKQRLHYQAKALGILR